jgi:4-hydroxybenzoate polyprenyltransferase
VRLGLSMLCLQASIGAVNDVADRTLDAVGKPAKPIPAGLVGVEAARIWAVATVLAALALALPSGPLATVIAGLCAALGYLYDLRLSRTIWSWLPLALALPLLPTFAWVGALGSLPSSLVPLLAVAFLAGGALIAANGLVDVDRDSLAGKATLAVRLGRYRTWLANVTAFTAAVGAAFLLAPAVPGAGVTGASGTPSGSGMDLALAAARTAGVPLGAFATAVGAGLLTASRAAIRERGWELEAIGTALVGVGWVAGIVLTGSGGGGAGS